MPEVPVFAGDLSEAAQLIYGPTIPAHARYAALKPTRLSFGGGGRPLTIGIIGFLAANVLCACVLILGFGLFAGQNSGVDLGSILGIIGCTFVPFMTIALLLFFVFGRRFAGRLTGKRTGTETCRISNPQPRPGESIDVSFDLGFESEMQVEGTSIELISRETVIYTAGTDRRTVHHETVIDSQTFMGRSTRQGDFLSENASFTLPADAMHTFIANRNRLLWFVKVRVAIKGRPDITNLYHLVVLP